MKIVRLFFAGIFLVLATMFSTITLQVYGIIPYPFQEGGLKPHPLFGFEPWVYILIPLALVGVAVLLFTADIRIKRRDRGQD
ncbi:hypothetical protein KKA23_01195 [Patescibacteria group bacterium]|nr:hypothetical protein [Patescibacteria group bacterium]